MSSLLDLSMARIHLRRLGAFGALITLGAVAIAPGRSHAGGLEYPDLGTVAIGRGTAFVAKADNGSAFYYNPAGLSKQPRGNVLVSGNLVHLSVDYERRGDDGCLLGNNAGGRCQGGFDPSLDYSQTSIPGQTDLTATRDFPTSSMDGFGPAPVVAASWTGIGKAKGLSLAIGLVPPSSFGTPNYNADGPQRYMVQESHILAVYPGIGLAYNINRYLQIGAVFLSGMAFVDVKQAARPLIQVGDPFRNEDLGGDAQFHIEGRDLFMPTAIFGAMSRPVDWLELGLSARLPVNVAAEGTLKYGAPSVDLSDSRLVGNDSVVVKQTFPWVVRAGVRYIHDYFDLEVDFVWEGWKRLQQFEIEFDGARIDQYGSNDAGDVDVPDTEIPKNFRDTYSVRVGSDIAVWPSHLTARVGGMFQSSAYPKNYETFHLDFPFGEQYGVGGGLTWHAIQYLDVSVGYMHIFQRDVLVTQGIVQQAAPPGNVDGEEVPIGNVVNNGYYKVALNLFGLSLQGHF